MTPRAFVGVWVLLGSTISAAAAPVPEGKDRAAEQVVVSSGRAAWKGDWHAYAGYIHPDSLRDFKALFAPVLRAAADRGREEQADLLSLFDGAKDLKTALAWEPKEFFGRFMKGYAAKGPWKPAPATTRVLGTVPEGPDQVHVVVRETRKLPKGEISRVNVMTLRRSGRVWKMMLPGEVRLVAETIRQMSAPGRDRATSEDAAAPGDPDK